MSTAKSVKGTQTEKNLGIAFMAESSAYARYTFFAKQANKELYFPVEQVFAATAANELRHAKVFLNYMQGGSVNVPLDVDAGPVGNTVANLELAIKEEQEEGVDFYTAAAKTAEEEGFAEIAEHFSAIATAEGHHKRRFEYFLKLVQDGTLWKREKPVTWRCLVCGYEVEGTEPPKKCPGCSHPYQHYVAVGDFDVE